MRSFSPRMAARALWQMRVRGRPFVLSHGINARCNLSCRFCEYWRHPGREMSTPEILRMLDEAHDFGIGVYNAWTVEPLLREDLPEILRHAKDLGLQPRSSPTACSCARGRRSFPIWTFSPSPWTASRVTESYGASICSPSWKASGRRSRRAMRF